MEVGSVSDLSQEHQDPRNRNMRDIAPGKILLLDQTQVQNQQDMLINDHDLCFICLEKF